MDDLNEDVVIRGLRGSFGRELKVFDEIGSTNDVALQWAAEGAPEGALVVTNHQTTGRGRWGRPWFSEPGTALQLSLVVRPAKPLDVMGLLTTAAGLGVGEGIELAAGIKTELKWPNDVTAGGRKLSGILVESHIAGPTLDYAVIGIGINVRAPQGDVPREVAARATSVYEEIERLSSDRRPSRVDLLGWVLDAFERVYPLVGTGTGAEAIVTRATKRSSVLGGRVEMTLANGDVLEGVARRILPSGALEVETDDGYVAVQAGEIGRLTS